MLLGLSDISKYIDDIVSKINKLDELKTLINVSINSFPFNTFLTQILQSITRYKELIEYKNYYNTSETSQLLKYNSYDFNVDMQKFSADKRVSRNMNRVTRYAEDDEVLDQVKEINSKSLLNEPEWNDQVLVKELTTQQLQIMQMTHSNIRAFNIEHKLFQTKLNSKREKLEPEDIATTYWNSGYINEYGIFYGFPDLMHIFYAKEIVEKECGTLKYKELEETPERVLELRGWIKLSEGRVIYYDVDDFVVSNKQWESILKWMNNPINAKSICKDRININLQDKYFTQEKIKQLIN